MYLPSWSLQSSEIIKKITYIYIFLHSCTMCRILKSEVEKHFRDHAVQVVHDAYEEVGLGD